MKYEVVYNGTMSTIIESEAGDSFSVCKKELLSYIDEKIKDFKAIKQEIKAMRKADIN